MICFVVAQSHVAFSLLELFQWQGSLDELSFSGLILKKIYPSISGRIICPLSGV